MVAVARAPHAAAPRPASYVDAVLPEQDYLYVCALKYLRNPHTALDLVQDTLLKAYEAWDSFDPARGNVRAWLATILKHTFISAYRNGKRADAFEDLPTEVSTASLYGERARAEALDPEGVMVHGVLSDEVQRALGDLSQSQRDTLLLDADGFSHAEISERLGVTINTVCSTLFRARMRLEAPLKAFAEAEYGISRQKKKVRTRWRAES